MNLLLSFRVNLYIYIFKSVQYVSVELNWFQKYSDQIESDLVNKNFNLIAVELGHNIKVSSIVNQCEQNLIWFSLMSNLEKKIYYNDCTM